MFHVFGYLTYYASGGMYDYKGNFETIEEARADVLTYKYENWEIAKVNEEGMLEVVEEG